MDDGFFPGGRRAAVCLTFDDARLSQVDVGMELFDRLGVRATFYVSPRPFEQRAEAWRQAVAAGHEIGNHTMSHPCTGNFPWSRKHALEEMTLEEMEKELLSANELIQQIVGVTPKTFAYPCGMTFVGRGVNQRSYVPLVAKHFMAGRLFRSEIGNDPKFCDPAHLFAAESDKKSFEEMKALVDAAVAQGRWLVFAGHEIGSGGIQTTTVAALEALCRYCRERESEIWIDTVANVATHVLQARQQASHII